MTTTPTQPSYKDAKAQAKAAKAYAKAQRPFYKKKRFIFPVAIVAIIIISMAMSGGSKDTGTVVKNSGASVSDAQAGSDDKAYKIGQTIELEGTQYTVTKATTQPRVGGAFGEKADGVFVVVDMTIENKKDETKVFSDTAATFHAQDDSKYEGSDAAIYLGDDSLFLREMQPDLPTKGKLVFDVPPTKVAGGVLVVEDLFGGGEAHIDLGLQ
jgi:hypothetical protein